jgi:hypothetical protein
MACGAEHEEVIFGFLAFSQNMGLLSYPDVVPAHLAYACCLHMITNSFLPEPEIKWFSVIYKKCSQLAEKPDVRENLLFFFHTTRRFSLLFNPFAALGRMSIWQERPAFSRPAFSQANHDPDGVPMGKDAE